MLGGGVAYIAAVPAVFAVLALRLGAWRTLVALIAVAHLVVLASVALFPLPVDPGLIAGGRAWAAGTAGESLNLVPFATIGPALAGVGGTGARVDRPGQPVRPRAGGRLPPDPRPAAAQLARVPAGRARHRRLDRGRPGRDLVRCSASGTATSTSTTGSSTPSASCSGSPPGGPGTRSPAGARAAADLAPRSRWTCRPARRDRAVAPGHDRRGTARLPAIHVLPRRDLSRRMTPAGPRPSAPTPPAPVDRRAVVAGAIVLLGFALVAVSLVGLVLLGRDDAAAFEVAARPAPPLELTDQDGQPFTLASLAGRPVARVLRLHALPRRLPGEHRAHRPGARGQPGRARGRCSCRSTPSATTSPP